MFDDMRLKFYPIDSETPVIAAVNLARCLSVETCVGILIPAAAFASQTLTIVAYDDAAQRQTYSVDPTRPVSVGCLMERSRGRNIVCRWNADTAVTTASWISRETKHAWVTFRQWPRHEPFAQIFFGVDFAIVQYGCRKVLYDVTTGGYRLPNMYEMIGETAGVKTFSRLRDIRSDGDPLAIPINRKRKPVSEAAPEPVPSKVLVCALDSTQRSIVSYLVRK